MAKFIKRETMYGKSGKVIGQIKYHHNSDSFGFSPTIGFNQNIGIDTLQEHS